MRYLRHLGFSPTLRFSHLMLPRLARPLLSLPLLAFGFLLAAQTSSAQAKKEGALPNAKIPEPQVLAPEAHYKDVAKRIYSNLPSYHYLDKPLDDDISKVALENYIKSLDPSRTLFLWDDIKAYRKNRLKLDDTLREGNVDFAFEVFRKYRANLAEQIAFFEKAVDEGFDLTVKENYIYDREKEPWPKTAAERKELWRQRIVNEYVASKVSRTLSEEEAAKRKAEGKKPKKDDDEEPPSIEEQITKRYRAILTNVNQHDSEHVLDTYLNAFTSAYDSHSAYLSPRRFEDFNINIGLSLTGIGAQLTVDEGAAEISSVIKGGPAAKDGRLKSGDKIIGVGQGDEEIVDIMYWPLYKSVRLIRGKKGSTVVLKVIPKADPGSVVKIDIVRDEVKLEENAAKAKIHELRETTKKRNYKLGYIDLPDFYEDMRRRAIGGAKPRSCSIDVKGFLTKMEEVEKVDGLVLDLRDNGGGSLRACVEMSGLFIESGPVVQVKDEAPKALNDPDRRQVFTKPLIVLINRHSASASEILAAALQDYGRAIIIGDSKTHGKGSVQSLFPLDRRRPDLGQFKVTTSAFFRINGRSTQLRGVTPDILLPSYLDSMEIGEEFLDNVIEWQKIDPVPFAQVGSLHNIITKLSKQSDERRKDNPDFKAYKEMLEKHSALQERESVTLNYEDRLAQTREDRKLGKLREQYGRQDIWDSTKVEDEDDKDEDEEKKDGKDLVLDESFRIMCDFIRAIEEQKLLIEGGA